MCLVVVDSHSKWIEAYPVATATSLITIEKLRYLFSQFGIPQSLVSDNAQYFVSEEFESFLKTNGIKHHTFSAYHPASNGLAEQAVQTLKNGLKKVRDGTLASRIARVLFSYRTAVHATTGRSPAELLIGRPPCTRMDLLVLHLLLEWRRVKLNKKQDMTKQQKFMCSTKGIVCWLEIILLAKDGFVVRLSSL